MWRTPPGCYPTHEPQSVWVLLPENTPLNTQGLGKIRLGVRVAALQPAQPADLRQAARRWRDQPVCWPQPARGRLLPHRPRPGEAHPPSGWKRSGDAAPARTPQVHRSAPTSGGAASMRGPDRGAVEMASSTRRSTDNPKVAGDSSKSVLQAQLQLPPAVLRGDLAEGAGRRVAVGLALRSRRNC